MKSTNAHSISKHYKIIVVASHFGAPKEGTHNGPVHIITELTLLGYNRIKDFSLIPVKRILKPTDQERIIQIANINMLLKEEIKKSIIEGLVPIILHGDDSSVIGTGFGLLESNLEFGVVYFDAHGDINSPETSITGSLYGMGLSHLIGNGYDKIMNIKSTDKLLEPRRIHLIGTRSLDEGEKLIVEKYKIPVFTVKNIRENLDRACISLLDSLKEHKIDSLYIHIDQDVIDPAFSGASLCREKNGLYPEELFSLLDYLVKYYNICALSFGNYLPSIDYNHKTLHVIRRCFVALGIG